MSDSDPATPPVSQHSSMKIIKPEERPRRSETLGKLAAALAKAQGEIENAEKDVKGNYGKYATLASTWDSIRGPLSKNEIAIYQRPLTVNGKLCMCTMLIHSSGEFIDDSELEMIFDRSGGRISPMQAMGSAQTYARRYTLQAATGVAPADDDDGEGAGKPAPEPAKSRPAPPAQPPKNKTQPQNQAPADDHTISVMYDLARSREVKAEELNYLIHNGYGVQKGKPLPAWIANECIKLLENEDCTAARVMAESQRVISRREAARIKAEAEKGGAQ